jgi:hypothetical protein
VPPGQQARFQPLTAELRELYVATNGLRHANAAQMQRFNEIEREFVTAMPRTSPEARTLPRPNRPLVGYGGAGPLSAQQAMQEQR